ncbi:K02A2.6-like [Cordylochernes scorpioides]|uniref:K02A2.6-like n=1 Tax=Cordylochernes scorpioides TaxID=51811 RepID=A0ABY6KX75_9ARAC|nr:K02A2.6-like [Cordylochernes scorpioides]
MEGIKPPAEFVPYSNEKKWETWRESFEIFAIAVNLESMPLVRQRAILKHIAGEKTVMIYKTFQISENDTYPNVKEMLDMLTNHFKPFKNTIQRRNAFFTCVQKERQGIMEFVTELKHLAQECEFENLTESLIRDRLIIGILDREVKRKLLEDPQLTLPRAISIAVISESTCSQVASLNEQKMIEKIEKRNWVKDTIRMENAEAGPSGINPRRERIIEPLVCRTKRIRNLLTESEAEESCDEINLNEVAVKTVRSDKWSAVIIINGKKTTVHLDTGAQINVLPHKVINQWPSRPEIRPTSLKAFAYGNTELPIVGKCNVLCQYGEKKGMFEFIVADVEAQTLITGDTCEKLEILRRINHINTDEMKLCSETQKILEQYHEVFQGVGLINSEYVKSAYWHIPVAKECRDLLVMTTPFGKFRYNRLPFGLKISAQIFVEKMTNIFRDSFQNITYVDDLLIYADTIQEHNKKLKGILEKAKEKNIKFDLTKAQICLTKVRFLGHVISQNGIDPEPNKIDKLITFKRPEDKKSLQRIMGLYNYLGKFIPNLAASTSNIRGILRKNVVWHWGPKQDGEFDHIKECVRNAPSLAHFDKSKMLILQCDASKDAMGAALLQEDRPLAFASASFSDSQKQYSQIEKELLSVYYGCKKFEYLLSGHTFVVQTDHQPLLPLVKKPLSDISPRLQRLVMKLIAFDFKLQYKPGKYLIVADTLSRDTHPMDELPTPFLEDKRMVKMREQRLFEVKPFCPCFDFVSHRNGRSTNCNQVLCEKRIQGCRNFLDVATAYGDAVMSRRRVFEWYKRFKEGREETADNERSGRPSISTTPEKVDKVLELAREDRRITVREVAEEAGISFGSTQSIMKDILGVRSLNAVFVPKDLTFDQKNARKVTASLNLEATTDDPELPKRASEWRFKNEPRPKKARKAPSKVKVMLTVFFDYQGIVHHEFQRQGSTITADSYLGVLRRLREAIRQKRPELWRSKSWILHHDNAPAHTALKISKFLQDLSTSVFPQPPYSPDLAPCDFFLFGKLKKKKKLKGRKFQSIEEIKVESKKAMKAIPKTD